MQPLAEKCSLGLIISALAVLAIDFELVTLGSMQANFAVFSVEGLTPTRFFVTIVCIAGLAALALCHMRHHLPQLARMFSAGYREAPSMVALVRATVALAAEDSKYGAPYGGIHGSLIPRSYDIGRFIKPSGALSDSVIISPSHAEHWAAVWNGIGHLLQKKAWLPVYAPLLLGVWALATIILGLDA